MNKIIETMARAFAAKHEALYPHKARSFEELVSQNPQEYAEFTTVLRATLRAIIPPELVELSKAEEKTQAEYDKHIASGNIYPDPEVDKRRMRAFVQFAEGSTAFARDLIDAMESE